VRLLVGTVNEIGDRVRASTLINLTGSCATGSPWPFVTLPATTPPRIISKSISVTTVPPVIEKYFGFAGWPFSVEIKPSPLAAM
jgi:hypothetical protein